MFWVYEQERKELLEICTHNATALNGLVAKLHLIDEYVSCLSKNMKVRTIGSYEEKVGISRAECYS
jgi:hypothetical protein